MIALALMVALTAEPEVREHRVSIESSVVAVAPLTQMGSLPLGLESTVAVDLFPFLRFVAIAALENIDDGRRLTSPIVLVGMAGPFAGSVLFGLEGSIPKLLPVELGGGATVGVTAFNVCSSMAPFCAGGGLEVPARVQLRAFAGYRFNPWLSVRFLASFNALVGFPAPYWVESGATLAVHL